VEVFAKKGPLTVLSKGAGKRAICFFSQKAGKGKGEQHYFFIGEKRAVAGTLKKKKKEPLKSDGSFEAKKTLVLSERKREERCVALKLS